MISKVKIKRNEEEEELGQGEVYVCIFFQCNSTKIAYQNVIVYCITAMFINLWFNGSSVFTASQILCNDW